MTGARRCWMVAAGMLAIAGCSAAPLPEQGPIIDLSSTLAFAVPVTSVIGRRFDTVVRQQYDFSCGSAALATLLRFHYGDPQSEQSVFLGMWRDGDQAQIRRLGFSLLDMKRYLAARHIAADGYRVTIDQIASAHTPGIALIAFEGYSHFVVVKGIDHGSLLIGDPSLGLRRVTTHAFQRQWNGILFVLTGPNEAAHARFDLAQDLARAPRGYVFPGGDPLDLAALALTRPLPGEL